MRFTLKLALSLSLSALSTLAQQLPKPHEVSSSATRHTGGLGASALSRGQSAVVASTSDGGTFVTQNGSVWSVQAGGTVGALDKSLNLLYLSSRGKWLAYVESNNNTVKIWTLASGEIKELPPFAEHVNRLAGSRDENTLAVSCGDQAPELFDVETLASKKKLVWSPVAHEKAYAGTDMAFSPNGTLLAYGHEVWTVPSGASALKLHGDFRTFSADGKTLWTQSGKTVDEWDVVKKEKTSTFELAGDGQARFTVSPDGRFGILSQPLNQIQLSKWDLHSGVRIGTVNVPSETYGYQVSFLGDSDWMLASNKHYGLLLVRVSTGDELATLDSHQNDWSVVRASDGAYDASADALVVRPNRSGGLNIDGIRVEKSSFTRVPGLLKLLPAAPTGTSGKRTAGK